MINQYAGTCAACHGRVPAGAGQRINQQGTWRTYHPDCVPAQTAPAAGDHGGWHRGPLVAFDLETTLPEPHDARVVQAALTEHTGAVRQWLVDPGIAIPPAATACHGITDEQVRSQGRPAVEAVAEIAESVNQYVAGGVPLVAFFASYDMTVLRAELARHQLPQIDWTQVTVIDPFVLHKQAEPGWRGKRTLSDLCAYYQVPLDRAHDAVADATACLAVAVAIAARHPRLAQMCPSALHQAQVEWFARDSRDLQRYYDRRGIERVVATEWPLETARRG